MCITCETLQGPPIAASFWRHFRNSVSQRGCMGAYTPVTDLSCPAPFVGTGAGIDTDTPSRLERSWEGVQSVAFFPAARPGVISFSRPFETGALNFS